MFEGVQRDTVLLVEGVQLYLEYYVVKVTGHCSRGEAVVIVATAS